MMNKKGLEEEFQTFFVWAKKNQLWKKLENKKKQGTMQDEKIL